MGMIRIYEKAGKSKRKPGWQQKEAEYQAWLKGVQSMSSGIQSNPRAARTPPAKVAAVKEVPVRKAAFVVGGCTKPVLRPEITYKDNPEMLERELKARERKFNVAPAFNKGADQLVTEESLQALLSSNKRRS